MYHEGLQIPQSLIGTNFEIELHIHFVIPNYLGNAKIEEL